MSQEKSQAEERERALKIADLGWRRGTYKIAQKDGKGPSVSGLVSPSGLFGLGALAGCDRALTHIPSGLAFEVAGSASELKILATRVENIHGADWRVRPSEKTISLARSLVCAFMCTGDPFALPDDDETKG